MKLERYSMNEFQKIARNSFKFERKSEMLKTFYRTSVVITELGFHDFYDGNFIDIV